MRRFLALALCLLTVGCLNEPTLPDSKVLAGSWTLQSVSGNPLPYTYPTGKQIVSETLNLNLDGSFTSLDTYSDGSQYPAQGVYTLLGTEIDFYDTLNQVGYRGEWSATSVTQIFGTFQLTFRKTP